MKGSSAGDEPEYLYLTTRGRKTGHERRIEIWFTRRGRSYYLVAEHGLRAQWVQNLLVEPRVQWRVGMTLEEVFIKVVAGEESLAPGERTVEEAAARVSEEDVTARRPEDET